MRTVALVQARMGSSRFPGKMLAKLGAYRLIDWVLMRTKLSKRLDEVILLTSERGENDVLASVATDLGCRVVRGSEDDVLSRYLTAQNLFPADAYVRVCADNPFICPVEIDRLVDFFATNKYDYAFNHVPKLENNYPDGFGAEIFSSATLSRLSAATKVDARYREHATLYIWEHMSEFKIGTLVAPDSLKGSEYRFDVDTPQDLAALQKISQKISIDTLATEILRLAR